VRSPSNLGRRKDPHRTIRPRSLGYSNRIKERRRPFVIEQGGNARAASSKLNSIRRSRLLLAIGNV
jgi:hypothetical protein